MILASLQNPDLNLLNEIIGLTSLTDNEKSVLKYTVNPVNVQSLLSALFAVNTYLPGETRKPYRPSRSVIEVLLSLLPSLAMVT